MADEPDPFEIEIVQNCPKNASYYYLVRFKQNKVQIRFPSRGALQVREPFEYPIDCPPGTWLVIYSSDAAGAAKVQHVGNRHRLQVELDIPDEVTEGGSSDGKVNQDLVEMIAKQAGDSDDADPELRAVRIDAKKRKIALGVTRQEHRTMLRGAKNKDSIEAYMLNRFHRTELHGQVDAMFKVQRLSSDMLERSYVLIEKFQEGVGRFAEMEKAAAQRIAAPPPPPDYTPVLSNLVGALRDIGVSALQREDRKQLKADDSAAPVKAALGDKAAETPALAAATPATSSGPAPGVSAGTDRPTEGPNSKADDRLAQIEAERDRLRAELAAVVERSRLQVLSEVQAESAQRERGPSRNERCPCGSGRAYRNCCLNSKSAGSSSIRTPASRWSARPQLPDARTPPPAEPARPHPTRASTPPPAEPARPHVPDASTPPPAEPARPHPTRASTPPPAEPARPHAPDASTPPPAEPARPHPSRASTPPPAEPARPHVPDARTPPPAEPARPHPTRASTPPPAEPARPHSAAARTPSPSEPARPQSAQPAEATSPIAQLASAGTVAAPSAQTILEMAGQPLVLPDGVLSDSLQEMLVNIHGSALFNRGVIPPPMVAQVKAVEAVIVNPPTMDRETARRLLVEGSAVEAMAGLLFFNPMFHQMLRNRRGK